MRWRRTELFCLSFLAMSAKNDGAGRIANEPDPSSASFTGHVLENPWDQLHQLCFTSYAISNYLTTPFLRAHPYFDWKDQPDIGPGP